MSEELSDNAHLENYMRRHVNDSSELKSTDDSVTESSSAAELADDKHMSDYIRRYVNDNES